MNRRRQHRNWSYLMAEIRDLELLINSSVPIIVIETHQEKRILDVFAELVQTRLYRPLFRWTVTEGLQRLDIDSVAQRHNAKPVELLSQIKATTKGSVYVLLDFHPFLDDPVHVRLLKDIATNYSDVSHTVVLVSHAVELPEELERFAVRFEFALPSKLDLEEIIRDEARQWQKYNPRQRIKTYRQTLDQLIVNLTGLSRDDARRLARGAIRDDGALTANDLPDVMRAKFELLGRDGVLSFEYDTARFADVGGLDRLKAWLELRRQVFTSESTAPGLDPPRGIMLLGVQGCGKSLAAKSVAGTWKVPLLQLDFGTLYNNFHGETERNLRESLKTSGLMAPCVLWIDEIEKGIGSDSHDGGTSRRVLGTLLTWLAEHQERVFIVATANDIESLPPELLRKGRLDEVFFVDLPDRDTRRIIARIHLEKRSLDAASFQLDDLADACEGFSGSEIGASHRFFAVRGLRPKDSTRHRPRAAGNEPHPATLSTHEREDWEHPGLGRRADSTRPLMLRARPSIW